VNNVADDYEICRENLERGGLPPLSQNGSKLPYSTSWPHAPLHRLSESGTYFVTAGTYQKQHFFRETTRLDVLQRGLISVCAEFGWRLEAWCMFPNHYHFVAYSPEDGANTLPSMLRKLHSRLAIWVNKLDATPGRQVWHNFWDTRLTYEKSYLARLHYTHANAVHHGLVSAANQYPWCSAAWFERVAPLAQVKTIYGIKTDTVRVRRL
jgi:putative transposase